MSQIAISTEVEFKGLHVKFVFRHKASNEGRLLPFSIFPLLDSVTEIKVLVFY